MFIQNINTSRSLTFMSPQEFRIIIKNKTRTKKYSTIVLRCLLAHEFVCVCGGEFPS